MTIRDFVCSTYFTTGFCGPALCCNRDATYKDVGSFKTRAEFEAVYCCFMLDCTVISCKSTGANNYYEGGSIANVMAMCCEFRSCSSYNQGTGKSAAFVNCIIRESFGNHNTVGSQSFYGCTIYNCQRGASNLSLIDSSNITCRNTLLHHDTSFPQAKLTVKGLSHCAMFGSYSYGNGSPDSSCIILR